MKKFTAIFSIVLVTVLVSSCGEEKTQQETASPEVIETSQVDEMIEILGEEVSEEGVMEEGEVKNTEEGVETEAEAEAEENMQNEETEVEDEMKDSGENQEAAAGVYTDYSSEAVANASGDIVLFFHADWCPTCVAFDEKVITEEIPENLTVLKVNYDAENQLKEKYGVTSQTTFVQIDSEGNKLGKWLGGRGIDDVVERLK